MCINMGWKYSFLDILFFSLGYGEERVWIKFPYSVKMYILIFCLGYCCQRIGRFSIVAISEPLINFYIFAKIYGRFIEVYS